MRTLLLTIMLFLPMVAVASDDQTIMFEIGMGFGNASGGRTDGNDNAKFCKNRNTGRMTYGAVRYSYDDVEVHVAKWWHDEDTRCNRDSYAVGLGYVLSTKDSADFNDSSSAGLGYASWTPGFAYTWGDDKDFTGQDRDNTNWRQTGNWQTFNRVALGFGDENIAGEVAVHRYGTFNPEHGEYFATVGLQLRDLDDAATDDGDRGLEQPGDTIIINEGDNITNINITDNSTTIVPEGYVPPTIVQAEETGNTRTGN